MVASRCFERCTLDITLPVHTSERPVIREIPMLISFTNKCLFGENKEICVSRPRRFGKSMAENMLTAYYSKGCDSRELFSKFQIAQTPDFEKHLNRYNVIHIDMQKFLGRTKNVHEMLDFLQKRVLKEMKQTFSGIEPEETSLIGRWKIWQS